MTQVSPFRHFKTSPEIIRLAMMMYVRFPLSLRNVKDLLHERRIDLSHETSRYWWNRCGPGFAADIKRKRIQQMRAHSNWKWHLDEVFVKINGQTHYLWRAENSHSLPDNDLQANHERVPFRRRERAMQRFRRMRSLQKFASIHSSVYNHFNQKRTSTLDQTSKTTEPPRSRNGGSL